MRAIDDGARLRIYSEYKKSGSASAAAKACGVSESTVRRVVREERIRETAEQRVRESAEQRVREAYEQRVRESAEQGVRENAEERVCIHTEKRPGETAPRTASCAAMPQGQPGGGQPAEFSVDGFLRGKQGVVLGLINKYLAALSDDERLEKATMPQIASAMTTLIEKFTLEPEREQTSCIDPLSSSFIELARRLESQREGSGGLRDDSSGGLEDTISYGSEDSDRKDSFDGSFENSSCTSGESRGSRYA